CFPERQGAEGAALPCLFSGRSLIEPEAGTGAALELAAELGPERLRVGNCAAAPGADFGAAVRLQQQPFEPQAVAVQLAEGGDRGATGAVEGGEHCPLGRHTGGTSRIVERFEERPQPIVCGTALDRE